MEIGVLYIFHIFIPTADLSWEERKRLIFLGEDGEVVVYILGSGCLSL